MNRTKNILHPLAALALLFVFRAAFSADQAQSHPHMPSPPPAVVESFRLSSFYGKYLDAQGLPVVASPRVADEALAEAKAIVDEMLRNRPDILRALIAAKIRVAVMGKNEVATQIPEHSDLTPPGYWNTQTRGLGATLSRPAISCAEENLLNLAGDRYHGENICIHEFAHTMQLGLSFIDPDFAPRLQALYDAARAEGLWENTYAGKNPEEYWAEAVQSYFDANADKNAYHNGINTREKLTAYDPRVYKFIEEVFRKPAWRYTPYAARPKLSE